MKTLIVEDDFTSRLLLQEILKPYGTTHIAVNGKEAVDAVVTAMDVGEPYDLICLDIMMPVMNGYEALKAIRGLEESRGIMFYQWRENCHDHCARCREECIPGISRVVQSLPA